LSSFGLRLQRLLEQAAHDVAGKAAALQEARLARPFLGVGRGGGKLAAPRGAGALELVGQVGLRQLFVDRACATPRLFSVWRRREAPRREALLRR